MAGCNTWTYKNVTAGIFKNLQALGKKQGFTIPSAPNGSFSIRVAGMQIGFQFSWNRGSGILQLQCISKPLIGCGTIKSYADKVIRESGGMPV